MGWIQKVEIDEEPLPAPNEIDSNDELEPSDQSEEQERGELRINELF